ncbi:unnamed protein product [Brassicogethes aeneus]|uniref:Attacin C-terminal domain-containing protein n=1 Tax=Brassicogethes aeneus TaxID=1431903 RepID=A0A9P0FNP2_BRAAE|nr:unnamed protein product [Brassicogethes aeneus]
MKLFLVFIATFVVAAYGHEIVSSDDGELFYLVPVHRVRRQTTFDINKNGPGTRVTLGHKGTIYENPNHKVTGGAFASQQFRPTGPLTAGGNLGYQHKPSGSGLNVGADNTRGFGTNVNAQGNLNLLRSHNGNTRLDATGGYSRHFGGVGGTGRPNYNAGLNFNHRF